MDRLNEINETIDQFDSNQISLSEFRYLIGHECNKIYSQGYKDGYKIGQSKVDSSRKISVLLEFPGAKYAPKVVRMDSVPIKGVVVELSSRFIYARQELKGHLLEFYVKDSRRIIDPELDYEFIIQLKLLK